MPSLGADMESGTLLEWLVKPGDAVKRGDIVAVVDTSKAEIEVEIFEDGVIDELLVGQGERVPVGTALATVLPADANGGAARARAGRRLGRGSGACPASRLSCGSSARPADLSRTPRPSTACASRRSHAASPSSWASISPRCPAAARMERSRGPTSRLSRRPRPAARRHRPSPPASQRPPSLPPADRQAAMREAIAALMARSKREIPHYYLQTRDRHEPRAGLAARGEPRGAP